MKHSISGANITGVRGYYTRIFHSTGENHRAVFGWWGRCLVLVMVGGEGQEQGRPRPQRTHTHAASWSGTSCGIESWRSLIFVISDHSALSPAVQRWLTIPSICLQQVKWWTLLDLLHKYNLTFYVKYVCKISNVFDFILRVASPT